MLHIHRGEDVIIYKRYKHYLRKDLIANEPCPPYELGHTLDWNPLGLKYLLILDFEATCEAINPVDYIHEIIEFPVLLLDLSNLEIVSLLHVTFYTIYITG